MTDATGARVCDTRAAINWIEDVGEDNDSLVVRSFFSCTMNWTEEGRGH